MLMALLLLVTLVSGFSAREITISLAENPLKKMTQNLFFLPGPVPRKLQKMQHL